MKKLLLALAMTATMAPSALAYSVGYVDTQRLMKEAKIYQQAQAKIQKEEEAYQKTLASHQKDLEEAQKKVKEEEFNKLRDQYSKELAATQQRIQQMMSDLSKQAQATTLDAVKKVAAQKKVDVVIDKQAVFYGGLDLTGEIINRLK